MKDCHKAQVKFNVETILASCQVQTETLMCETPRARTGDEIRCIISTVPLRGHGYGL